MAIRIRPLRTRTIEMGNPASKLTDRRDGYRVAASTSMIADDANANLLEAVTRAKVRTDRVLPFEDLGGPGHISGSPEWLDDRTALHV